MSIFPKALAAAQPKTKDSGTIAIFYAVILGLLAVSQLVMFQTFPLLVESFWLPGGKEFSYFLAAFIVLAELFAIPFLLRLKLSVAFRVLSMVMGWIVPALWLAISLWIMFSDNAVSNIGLFGTSVTLAPGWWTVLFSIAIGILAAWASWGLWPFSRRK